MAGRASTNPALRALLRSHVSEKEAPKTLALIKCLRPARTRKYLTKRELVWICRWKSARAIRLIRSNTHHRIREATSTVFATRSEQKRLTALLGLRGVSIPMASAILMLLSPRRYGVIDIRVWQLLHEFGLVTENPAGTGFTASQWSSFLSIIRAFSTELGVSARDVERTFFNFHQSRQKDVLYRARRTL